MTAHPDGAPERVAPAGSTDAQSAAEPYGAEAAGSQPAGLEATGPGSGFGDPRVDAAMSRLGTAGGRTPADEVAEYEAVHRVLQDTLATIDEA